MSGKPGKNGDFMVISWWFEWDLTGRWLDFSCQVGELLKKSLKNSDFTITNGTEIPMTCGLPLSGLWIITSMVCRYSV
jgi:hypothetical protein